MTSDTKARAAEISPLCDRLLALVNHLAGDQPEHQFLMVAGALGRWIESQPDRARWIELALDLIRKHQSRDQERCDG